MVGIYYDNPMKLDDKMKARMVAGLIVPSDTPNEKLSNLGRDYKTADLPEVKAIATSFPYKSILSFVIKPFKVYPKFEEYSKKNSISTEEMKGGCIEVYNYVKGKNSIDSYLPYGIGSDKYNLATAPQPKKT